MHFEIGGYGYNTRPFSILLNDDGFVALIWRVYYDKLDHTHNL